MVTASEESNDGRRMFSSPAEKRINHPQSSSSSPPSSRSRRSLHNFSFPPNVSLTWGNQRVLRCVNPTNPNPIPSPRSIPNPALSPAEEEPTNRPWNLRTRRAAGNAQTVHRNPSPPYPSPSPSPKSPVEIDARGNLGKSLRSSPENGGGERCKFSVGLSREEIEEDFLKIRGSKPPRRPKKRAKYIQRQLDLVFPGLSLSEITPDLYKIDEENLPV